MPPQQDLEGKPRRGTFAAAFDAGTATAFEAVRVRNYDHRQHHSVTVVVSSIDGEQLLTDRHTLEPGETARSYASLQAGEYELRVGVDGVERASTTCRFDRSRSTTAVLELGNGAVSLT